MKTVLKTWDWGWARYFQSLLAAAVFFTLPSGVTTFESLRYHPKNTARNPPPEVYIIRSISPGIPPLSISPGIPPLSISLQDNKPEVHRPNYTIQIKEYNLFPPSRSERRARGKMRDPRNEVEYPKYIARNPNLVSRAFPLWNCEGREKGKREKPWERGCRKSTSIPNAQSFPHDVYHSESGIPAF